MIIWLNSDEIIPHFLSNFIMTCHHSETKILVILATPISAFCIFLDLTHRKLTKYDSIYLKDIYVSNISSFC